MKLVSIVLYLCVAVNVPFHGDLHERIQEVTSEININPDSTLLYLKRGELYFQHEEYDSSGYDFEKCEQLGNFPPSRLYFNYAKTLNIQDKDHLALSYLNKILLDDPYNVNTLRLKGKILIKQKKYCDAGILFEKVIDHANSPLPFNYLEASDAYGKCNDQALKSKSVEALQSGINSLGPLITFYHKLIEIHLDQNNFEQAIYFQTLIIDTSKRKEFPLYKRAQLHVLNGDDAKAKKDIVSAKNAIGLLPHRIKTNRSTQELIKNIDELLSKS